MDLDETMIHTVMTENAATQQNSDIVMKNDNMAIYYRPFLFEYLKAFTDGTLNMEIGLFTKGT